MVEIKYMYNILLISPPGTRTFLRSQLQAPTEEIIRIPCGYNKKIAIFKFSSIESTPENGNFCYYTFESWEDAGAVYG